MRITPAKAIRMECKYCMGTYETNIDAYKRCKSRICKLNDYEISSTLRRIKAHCISCIPEHSIFGVQKCNGEILNPVSHLCPLHQFRLGHNPYLKGMNMGKIGINPCKQHRVNDALQKF